MSSPDAVIAALRAEHEVLVATAPSFSDDDLARPSGAAEWDVSQVLSHLGSGGEIAQAGLQAALDGKPNPGRDYMESVWDRWNGMTRRERADGFVEASRSMTELFESLDAETRESLRVDIGFLPEPIDVANTGRLRLGELALHSWDIRVAFDDDAVLSPEATELLLAGVPDMFAWISKPDQLEGKQAVIRVTTSGPESVFALKLQEQISVDSDVPADPDGTLTLPAEAWLRLVTGRLAPEHTPDGIVATGAADVELLRRVFPGY